MEVMLQVKLHLDHQMEVPEVLVEVVWGMVLMELQVELDQFL
jgi:hypothetical protein